jgi:hypothetical protein
MVARKTVDNAWLKRAMALPCFSHESTCTTETLNLKIPRKCNFLKFGHKSQNSSVQRLMRTQTPTNWTVLFPRIRPSVRLVDNWEIVNRPNRLVVDRQKRKNGGAGSRGVCPRYNTANSSSRRLERKWRRRRVICGDSKAKHFLGTLDYNPIARSSDHSYSYHCDAWALLLCTD